ncbi:MAG: hypothetical protein H6602_06020, partial [Flavobacteriales bacterium]|nr:hypothetical protein [Flavobacteriales bacterium]
MEENLLNLIKANVKLIQIISYESLRIHAMLVHSSQKLKRELFAWNRVDGIRRWNAENKRFEVHEEDFVAPNSALEFFDEHQGGLILLLEDFHPDLTEDKPGIVKTL